MKDILYQLFPTWLKIRIYEFGGKKQFHKGYVTYKFAYIAKSIREKETMEKFRNSEQLPPGFGHTLDERSIEYPWALSKIPAGPCNFLDAGSTLNIKSVLEHPIFANKKVTIINLNPETDSFWYNGLQKGISYVFGDIRIMPFMDSYFDVVTCISTLEHIGLDNTAYLNEEKYREANTGDFEKAVVELKRVLKPGGKLLITVPFGKYENFGWFQQFDQNLVQRVLDTFQGQNHKVDYYKYGEQGWDISDAASCRDVQYLRVPELDSWTARAVACLELTK